MVLIAIGACVFLGASFLIMGFVMEAQSRQMSDRFTVVASAVIEDDDPTDLRGSLRERIIQPMLARLNGAAMRLTPSASVKATFLRLDRAGRPWGLTPGTWGLLRMGGAAVGGIGALITVRHLPLPGHLALCAAALIAAAGALVPSFCLDTTIKRRQARIRRNLPDVIDLLVVSVEAGLGLDAAVQEVVRRRTGPLLDEFGRVLAEIRVGKTRRRSWQEMAERVDVLEARTFVAALVQAEELGASIAGVLRNQSETLRVRRSLLVREVAAMLPVKMLFPLIFCIFPGVFVVILGPGMITLVDTFRTIGF